MNTNTKPNRNALRRAIAWCGVLYTNIRHLAPGRRTQTAPAIEELLTDLGHDLYDINHTILSRRYGAWVRHENTTSLVEELLNQVADLLTVLHTARVPRRVATGLASWITALTDIHHTARTRMSHNDCDRDALLNEVLGQLGDLAEQCLTTRSVR